MNLATFVSASLFFLSISSKSIGKQSSGFNTIYSSQLKLTTTSTKSNPFKLQNNEAGQSKSKTERTKFITLQPTTKKNLPTSKEFFLKTVLNNTKITTKMPQKSVNINFQISQNNVSKSDPKKSSEKLDENIKKIATAKDAGVVMQVSSNEEKFGLQTKEDNQYNWVRLYDTCSVSCGGGYQNFNVVCYNGTVLITDEQPCAKLKKKPMAGKSVCGQQPCFLPRWDNSDEWTVCSVTCGTGERMRFQRCIISWSGPTKVREVEARMCTGNRTANIKEPCVAAVTCPPVLNRQGDCKGTKCKPTTATKGVGGAAKLSRPGLSPLILVLFICSLFVFSITI